MVDGAVLLVDDDPVFVHALRAVLQTRFDVRTAASGEEAIVEIDRSTPDLIVLDVMMTYPSEGYDLARTLRGNPATADIPIIILTGVSKGFEARSKTELNWVDVEQFMTKPPDFGMLMEKIGALIAGRGTASDASA